MNLTLHTIINTKKMSFTICLLQCIAFLDLLAVSMILPLMSNHVREMGGSHIIIGLLGSIYAGFQLGSGPFIGSLSDLKGRKTILIGTLLVCGVGYIVLGLTTSIIVILITRAVLGLFKQTQMLSRALVPDYETSKPKQSEIYGKMAAISGMGMTVGPIISGHVVTGDPERGFATIAVAVGLCFTMNAGMVYFLLPQSKNRMHARPSDSARPSKNTINLITDSIKQSAIELYNVEWSKFWDIFLLKALVGFAMGIYYSNYSLYLKTEFELSQKHIGYVISFQGVVGSLSSFFMGFINSFYSHDEDYSLRNLHVFLLLSISLVGLILSIDIYLYVIWLVPLAIGNAIGRLVTLEMILKRCHVDDRGKLMGASNSVRSLSGVVAPMVSGVIGQYFGLRYVIYASFFSTLVGLIMSYYYRKTKYKVE